MRLRPIVVFSMSFSAVSAFTIGGTLLALSGCGGGGGGGNGGTSNPSPTKDLVLASNGQLGAGGYGMTMIDTAKGTSQVIADATSAAWSPDARKIAISRFAPTWGGKPQLFSMNPDGTGTFQVTSDNIGSESGSFSPDGQQIVVGRGDYSIVVMNADGKNAHPLTSGITPVWSPHGDKIAFFADWSRSRLAVIQPDGSGLQSLASPPTPSDRRWGSSPSWSPDGTRMALSALDGQIYAVSATDPTGIVPLTSASVESESPVWSPDGSKIAFDAQDSAGYFQLFTVPSGGGMPTQITTGNQSQIFPTWSPDSRRIAFIRFSPSGGQLRFGIVNADGTNPQNLDIPVSMSSGTSRPLLWAPK